MMTENIRSIPVTSETPSEDDFAGALLAAARRYGGARSEHDLAVAFFESVAPFARGLDLTVRMRDPADRVIRAVSQREDSSVVRARALVHLPLAPEVTDLDGWTLGEPSAPEGSFDLPGIVDESLVAVISARGLATDAVRQRLARFAEQFASAVVDLGDRSETARLRLYAGSIVDRTNVPIAVVDATGAVRLSNDAMRSTLGGRTSDEVVSSILERIDSRDRHRALLAHTRAFRGERTIGVEISLGGPLAPEIRMLVDFEPIPLPSGLVESVLVVARDVTRVRQLEDQVTHADRLATLGQLAAGVVHELNNPLTSILVYTEYLLRKMESSDEASGDTEKLRRVLGAARRIEEFARNLVAYSRVERGEREQLSVASVLDEAVAFCDPLIDRKRISIVRAYEDVPEVPAVRGQLQQIFINLLTNGIQAISEESGRIYVSVAVQSPGFVAIRFDDNGPGIPLDRREEIFRPFVTTKPTGQGTGLGLSIVRNLVDRHGGTIEVDRSSMGGASFVLAFPLKSSSEPPPPMVS